MKLVFSLLLVLSLLVSCTPGDTGAALRLGELLEGLPALPAGRLYDSAVRPYGEGYCLSEELVLSLYARPDGRCEYGEHVEEGAVYLSLLPGEYCEAAIFLCYGNADRQALFEMCGRRARLVRSRFGVYEEPVILCSGRTVFFFLSSDRELVRAAKDAFS